LDFLGFAFPIAAGLGLLALARHDASLSKGLLKFAVSVSPAHVEFEYTEFPFLCGTVQRTAEAPALCQGRKD